MLVLLVVVAVQVFVLHIAAVIGAGVLVRVVLCIVLVPTAAAVGREAAVVGVLLVLLAGWVAATIGCRATTQQPLWCKKQISCSAVRSFASVHNIKRYWPFK